MSIPSRSRLRGLWRAHKLIWNLTGGRLGSRVDGMDVLELTTTGHRSGEPRSVLLYYLDSPEGPLLAGSNAGAGSDPAWIRNLRAEPRATIRRRGRTRTVTARFLDGEQREAAYQRLVGALPDYGTYAGATDREIPVVVLDDRA